MKFFYVDDCVGWHLWEFRCREYDCDNCKLRFMCLTNKDITIVDEELSDALGDYYYSRCAQRKARKRFFKYLRDEK